MILKKLNKNHILELKNSTIGDILCQEISPKYTKILEKIKKFMIKLKIYQ